MSLFRTKSLESLRAQAAESSGGLHRTLGPWNLIALGIGAIIGAGLFVRTAAAAGEAAGAAVTLSFVVAAIGCVFAGLCYAEFAAMIPISGSAYAYAYVTMGEVVAWVIGWALVLEYALGAATVANVWTEYFNRMLEVFFHTRVPYEWSHTPFETLKDANGAVLATGIVNLPAIGILAALTALLIKGTKEAAWVNAIIVFLKVAIVVAFIAVGWGFINAANHSPYMIPEGVQHHEGFFQHGWGGVLRGAGIVFFAFIGFDAVSTAAQEAKRPERTMPIGILGSLAICTVLYILFAHVLTGVAPWSDFDKSNPAAKGGEASVAYAIATYMKGYNWLADAVTLAILAGFSSVILVMLLGQSRVFYSMANDGLLPKVFAELHPKFRTPWKSNLLLFVFVAAFAGFVPEAKTGSLTSIGTLFAFVIVCAGVVMMRKKQPELARPFRTPLVPLVPILGMIVCATMIIGLDPFTQLVALAWMAGGLLIYFGYSRANSKHQQVA
jgi:APA family basic amino acid/polyamine antiporter